MSDVSLSAAGTVEDTKNNIATAIMITNVFFMTLLLPVVDQ
jgi:hypothetical protein